MKDRFNHNVFPLGGQVAPLETGCVLMICAAATGEYATADAILALFMIHNAVFSECSSFIPVLIAFTQRSGPSENC